MSQEWKQFGNCTDMPLSWFFEDYELHQQEVDDACASCVVRKECLEYAIEINAEGGYFARRFFSSSSKEKSKLRKSPDRKVKVETFTV